MHRSRLSMINIDCDEDTMEAGVRFWSGALGMAPDRPDDPADPYVDLEGKVGTLGVGMQRIGDTSRIHLDIETDDLEAEVQRLEQLGARRKEHIESWWVMEDPSGQLFCVVPQGSDDFLTQAHVWDE